MRSGVATPVSIFTCGGQPATRCGFRNGIEFQPKTSCECKSNQWCIYEKPWYIDTKVYMYRSTAYTCFFCFVLLNRFRILKENIDWIVWFSLFELENRFILRYQGRYLVEFAGHLGVFLPQHLAESQGAGGADGQETRPRHQQLLACPACSTNVGTEQAHLLNLASHKLEMRLGEAPVMKV